MGCIGRVALRVTVGCVLVFGGAGVGLGQVVINEIMYDPNPPAPSVPGEWFELYNAGSSPVDLSGWTFSDGHPTNPNTFTISGALSIGTDAYLVLGREDDASANGGVVVNYEYGSAFSLGNGDDEIIIVDGSSSEVDRVEYDENPWPVGDGAALALKSPVAPVTYDDFDNNDPANWCVATTAYGTGALGTPGAANDCPPPEPEPDPVTGEIFVIQGPDRDSPHIGAMATTNDNIVTAVGAGGFFMQTPTSRSDSNVNTSEGIFVVHGGTPTIAVGDQVDVVGRVLDGRGENSERATWFFARIDATVTGGSVTIDASNQPLPAPVEFNATRPSPNPRSRSCRWGPECWEGMRIRVASGTVASSSQPDSADPDPIGEMYVYATASRPFREPGIEYPGERGLPVWDGNPELFLLDPDKLGLTNVSWDAGTTFTATGVLAYEFFDYEFWPTELTLQAAGPALPRAVRAKQSAEVTVASQNLLNLRASANATKLGKLSGFIREVLGSPDIVAVQEVYGQTALGNLATQITTDDANVTYTAYVEAPGSGSQAVGFLVRSGVTVNQVTEYGRSETFVDPRDGSVDPLNDRPPVVLDATVGDLDFSVVAIHNRSLRDLDDAARGEWIRTKRLEQAQSVARLVESLQDSKVIVVGDYNGYEFSDGYADVVGQIAGKVTPSRNLMSGPDLVTRDLCVLTERVPASDRYSIFFEGSVQMLDHALVNQNLEGHVVEIQYGRGNVDASIVNEDDATNVLRASDHDGFVVYLSPDAEPAVNPSPCQGPPPPPPSGGTSAMADLDLDAESQVVSASKVRYSVSVENAGPDAARNVVVMSSFAGGVASMEATTSGCDEDPGGVPDCSLGDIVAGDSASFTIDVDTGGASEFSLRYNGSVGSETMDPTPRDDDDSVVQPLGPPNAPTDLAAAAISSTEIELRWRDNSSVETGFDVFLQGPGDSKLRLIGSVPGNTTSTVVDDLVPDIRYNFAVEAYNGPLRSERTPKSTATTWFSDAARCSQDDVLCLGNFEVEVEWNDGKGGLGRGMAERLTADAGDFWFFDPANIELVVKVLDGCQVNGHYWVFAAGLTNVEVTTTIRDLKSGLEMSWTNPQGTLFEPLGDTSAFATCGEASNASRSGSAVRLSGAPKGRAAELYRASLTQADRVGMASSACTASETALCLQNSRYEVQANWQTGERSGAATVIPRTADTGMFWFFSPGNVELIVKVLDGCALNGHRWVLMGGLTDVGVEIVVTDSESGEAKMYGSPEGSPFATRFDVTAFSCSAGQ